MFHTGIGSGSGLMGGKVSGLGSGSKVGIRSGSDPGSGSGSGGGIGSGRGNDGGVARPGIGIRLAQIMLLGCNMQGNGSYQLFDAE